MQLLTNYKKIEDVFCKVLTTNDDSGRHGVLIPVFAYRLFPEFEDFDPVSETNYEADIITHWNESGGWVTKKSKWKHYHRYPERRMTSLSPELLNNKVDGSLIVVGRFRDSFEYECHVIPPNDANYEVLGRLFKLNLVNGKLSGSSIVPVSYLTGKVEPEVIDELMEKIKDISYRGYVETLRQGDTGIGYTFESLLDIAANSDKAPDYKGIEIKCSRSAQVKEKRKAATGKQTLFSLIPNWDIAKDRRGLVENYGYFDETRGRKAIYCSIKVIPNSYNWRLVVDEHEGKIYVCQNNLRVVSYNLNDLRAALESKHKESVFVTAHTRKTVNGVEEFHYDSVVHCKQVLFSEFLAMVKEGVVILDFAIHSKDGKVRDHGFLWRLENKKYIYRLFKYVQELM